MKHETRVKALFTRRKRHIQHALASSVHDMMSLMRHTHCLWEPSSRTDDKDPLARAPHEDRVRNGDAVGNVFVWSKVRTSRTSENRRSEINARCVRCEPSSHILPRLSHPARAGSQCHAAENRTRRHMPSRGHRRQVPSMTQKVCHDIKMSSRKIRHTQSTIV